MEQHSRQFDEIIANLGDVAENMRKGEADIRARRDGIHRVLHGADERIHRIRHAKANTDPHTNPRLHMRLSADELDASDELEWAHNWLRPQARGIIHDCPMCDRELHVSRCEDGTCDEYVRDFDHDEYPED